MRRVAVSTDDVVERLESSKKKITSSQSREYLRKTLNLPDGIQKIGQAMIGPILLKLKYMGVVRSVLIEAPLAQGEVPEYDVADEAKAYYVNEIEGEVFVTPFEGRRVMVPTFIISSAPTVRKTDLYALRYNILQHAQEQATMEIQKKEDEYLVKLLDDAITDYEADGAHTITTDHSVDYSGATLVPKDIHNALGIVASHQLEATKIMMNSEDYYQILDWDTDSIGWKAREQLTDTGILANYGPLAIQKSVAFTKGISYVLPDPQYVGVMPVRWSLDATELNEPRDFRIGWVLDEDLGMAVLNPRGIVSIVAGA